MKKLLLGSAVAVALLTGCGEEKKESTQTTETKQEIKKEFEEQAKRTLITADRVLEEIYRLATCDIGEAYNDDGSLKPIKEIPENIRRAISSVETDELRDFEGNAIGVTKKIKFWEKCFA